MRRNASRNTSCRSSHNGEAVGTVHLKPSEFIDEFALLPGTKQRPPLLAVAIVEFSQPMLRLYDAHTGEHIRQLTGHVNRIHSLAFSGNGKLLVSAAEDQTTCVWGLGNLDQLLGKKGMIHGLIVSERNKELALAPIDEAVVGPDNFKKLSAAGVKEGDVIEGLVVKDKLQPTTTVPDFYDAVVVFAPGQLVTLRIAKRGDVTLRVGQATDGHRPLLTLFVTRAGKGGVRHWVGWNPVGPTISATAMLSSFSAGSRTPATPSSRPCSPRPASIVRSTTSRTSSATWSNAATPVGPSKHGRPTIRRRSVSRA